MSSSRVVVTGGYGYIGQHLVQRLYRDGEDVHVLGPERRGIAGVSVGTLVADVRDPIALNRVLQEGDRVIHLACRAVGPSRTDPRGDFEVNARGTFEVLDACRARGAERVVYISSAEVYGVPHREIIDIDHPTRPTSPYGASKLSGEAYAGVYRDLFGLLTTTLRLFNVFGAAVDQQRRGTVETIFAERAAAGEPIALHGHPEDGRDFVHVSVVVEAVVGAMRHRNPQPIYNVGSGENTPLRAIADACGGEVVVAAPVPSRDPMAFQADIRMARADLGIRPSITVIEYARAVCDEMRRKDSPQ